MSEASAKMVVQQMGGFGRLQAMTGASGFIRAADEDGYPELRFKFKNRRGPNYVGIALTPADTYTMRFYRTRKWDLTPKGVYQDVYASQLKPIFEEATGLYLSLNNPNGKRNPMKATDYQPPPPTPVLIQVLDVKKAMGRVLGSGQKSPGHRLAEARILMPLVRAYHKGNAEGSTRGDWDYPPGLEAATHELRKAWVKVWPAPSDNDLELISKVARLAQGYAELRASQMHWTRTSGVRPKRNPQGRS